MKIKFRSNSKKICMSEQRNWKDPTLVRRSLSVSVGIMYHIVIGKTAIVHRRHRCWNLFSELFRCLHKILSKVFSKECTGHSGDSENLSGLYYRLQSKYQNNRIPYIEVPGVWELDPGAENWKAASQLYELAFSYWMLETEDGEFYAVELVEWRVLRNSYCWDKEMFAPLQFFTQEDRKTLFQKEGLAVIELFRWWHWAESSVIQVSVLPYLKFSFPDGLQELNISLVYSICRPCWFLQVSMERFGHVIKMVSVQFCSCPYAWIAHI